MSDDTAECPTCGPLAVGPYALGEAIHHERQTGHTTWVTVRVTHDEETR